MTGWRIGYAGGPGDLIKAMRTVISQTTSNPCSISQWAALAALEGGLEFLAERNESFRMRRDLVVDALNDAPGIICRRPAGAFYVFPDASALMGKASPKGAPLPDDIAFATALLDEEGVAIVPGSAFGRAGAFRVSYATDTQSLVEATRRIGRFCAGVR